MHVLSDIAMNIPPLLQLAIDANLPQQMTQSGTQEVPSEHQVFFTVQVMEHLHRLPRVSGLSLLGDPQKPSGYRPGQPALGGPVRVGGGPDGPRGPCQPQPFSHSVRASFCD